MSDRDERLTFSRCGRCLSSIGYDVGRAVDGRRAYRCKSCDNIHTSGMQGRQRRYSDQRNTFQFKDTGASSFSLDEYLQGRGMKNGNG